MGQNRYRVPAKKGWQCNPASRLHHVLPLCRANRDSPARAARWPHVSTFPIAEVESNGSRVLRWSVSPDGAPDEGYWPPLVYGFSASLKTAKRRAEFAARKLGLRPSRYADSDPRPRRGNV
jgi:hypothetical protein